MKLDILAIASHPDDIEIACAGTLMHHIQLGHKVGVLDLTKGEMGTRGTPELRLKEAQDAASILGLAVRENIGLSDCYFQNDEAHQLKVIEQIRRFQPEIVICNAPEDRHPDHGKASRLTVDSCFYAGLAKIKSTWMGQEQTAWRPKQVFHYIQDKFIIPDFVVDITPFWERKRQALQAFGSQFYQANSTGPQTHISTETFWLFMEARARETGHYIGASYGEGFLKTKMLASKNLFDFL